MNLDIDTTYRMLVDAIDHNDAEAIADITTGNHSEESPVDPGLWTGRGEGFVASTPVDPQGHKYFDGADVARVDRAMGLLTADQKNSVSYLMTETDDHEGRFANHAYQSYAGRAAWNQRMVLQGHKADVLFSAAGHLSSEPGSMTDSVAAFGNLSDKSRYLVRLAEAGSGKLDGAGFSGDRPWVESSSLVSSVRASIDTLLSTYTVEQRGALFAELAQSHKGGVLAQLAMARPVTTVSIEQDGIGGTALSFRSSPYLREVSDAIKKSGDQALKDAFSSALATEMIKDSVLREPANGLQSLQSLQLQHLSEKQMQDVLSSAYGQLNTRAFDSFLSALATSKDAWVIDEIKQFKQSQEGGSE